MSELTHTTATVTVQDISSSASVNPRNANDVDFMVKYPEGYKGAKIMEEGLVVVSKEAAEQFTSMGIGKVATDVVTTEEETVATDVKAGKKTKK